MGAQIDRRSREERERTAFGACDEAETTRGAIRAGPGALRADEP